MIRRIVVFTANRAERGLLEPVMAEFQAIPGILCNWAEDFAEGRHLHPDDLISGMELAAITGGFQPDIALVPCDRQEMVGVALYLFYHNIPFAQLHAGDTGSGVHDEIGRWIISRCASIHLCNTPLSAQSLLKSGEEAWRIHLVGSTAFDHVALDESLVPKEDFDLLLVHPDTFDEIQTGADISRALNSTDPLGRLTIAIGPNHDRNWAIIDRRLEEWKDMRFPDGDVPFAPELSPKFIYYPHGLPRPQFLALVKHCKRFITNSSSALYELPAFDISKYVPIGNRNAERKPLDKIELGGSKRIAQILATIELNDVLLRKKFQ